MIAPFEHTPGLSLLILHPHHIQHERHWVKWFICKSYFFQQRQDAEEEKRNHHCHTWRDWPDLCSIYKHHGQSA